MEKTYFISREDFIKLKAAWKIIPAPTAADMVIYNVLRSFPGVRGFVPKTKVEKSQEWRAFIDAKYTAYVIVKRSRKYTRTEHISTLTGHKHLICKWEDMSTEEHKELFKTKWGIDLPDGLADLIKESKHD